MVTECSHCVSQARRKGMCSAHYARWRKGSPMDEPVRRGAYRQRIAKPIASSPSATPRRMCGFGGCGRTHLAGGLCGGHYQQRRNGKELTDLRFQTRIGLGSGPLVKIPSSLWVSPEENMEIQRRADRTGMHPMQIVRHMIRLSMDHP